jgi:hypothetical protein
MANSSSSAPEIDNLRGSSPRQLSRDWRALRLVRARVLYTELAFWMVLFGYNTRERKFDNPAYLVYVVVFFAFWIFMVLLLMADIGARLLRTLPLNPTTAGVAVGSLGLAAFFLFSLFQAARRSAFAFTEQDAQILGATPLDRRLVALTWFFEGWIPRGMAVGAVATVLGYALLQALAPRELTSADLPVFLLAGLRMFIVAVPISLGLLGLAWALGALRLRGQREQVNLRWLAPVLTTLLLAGLALGGWNGLQAALIPLSFPVQAGLGLTPWLPGMLTALAWAAIGPLALWFAAQGLSLARAAQETQDREAIQAAAFLGKASLLDDLTMRQRLGTGHAPSSLPARPDEGALLWKNSVQAVRRLSPGEGLLWLAILAANLILLAFPGWETRAWATLGWTLLICQLIQAPLQNSLSRWWLLHLLPFRPTMLIATTLALPVTGAWLAGLAALLVARWLGWVVPPEAVWLYLVSVPGVALAGTLDVLRQARTGTLLVGTVPGTTLVSVLLALLVLAINSGALWLFLVSMKLPWGYGMALSIAAGLGTLLALGYLAANQLRNIP